MCAYKSRKTPRFWLRHGACELQPNASYFHHRRLRSIVQDGRSFQPKISLTQYLRHHYTPKRPLRPHRIIHGDASHPRHDSYDRETRTASQKRRNALHRRFGERRRHLPRSRQRRRLSLRFRPSSPRFAIYTKRPGDPLQKTYLHHHQAPRFPRLSTLRSKASVSAWRHVRLQLRNRC